MEALSNTTTNAAFSTKYSVHPSQIQKSKVDLIKNAGKVFSNDSMGLLRDEEIGF